MRRPLPAILLVVLASGTGAVPAWTPETDRQIVAQALGLMPPALRGVLTKHRGSLHRGLIEAAADEGSPHHLLEPAQQGASAALHLERLADRGVELIDTQRPFSELARLLGQVAHFVADLNNPLRVASDDPREAGYAADYEEYVASNLSKYPVVFYGWESEHLDRPPGVRGDVRGFAEETARRARGYYEPIRRAYAPENKAPLSTRFGERSLPFGIGSLSFSHAVSDTARLWLHVWRRAHGDTAGTPYAAPEPAPLTSRGDP